MSERRYGKTGWIALRTVRSAPPMIMAIDHGMVVEISIAM